MTGGWRWKRLGALWLALAALCLASQAFAQTGRAVVLTIDGALTRIINFPARGIGSRSLEQLAEVAKERSFSLWASVNTKPRPT